MSSMISTLNKLGRKKGEPHPSHQPHMTLSQQPCVGAFIPFFRQDSQRSEIFKHLPWSSSLVKGQPELGAAPKPMSSLLIPGLQAGLGHWQQRLGEKEPMHKGFTLGAWWAGSA